jgi:hypothetical protein
VYALIGLLLTPSLIEITPKAERAKNRRSDCVQRTPFLPACANTHFWVYTVAFWLYAIGDLGMPSAGVGSEAAGHASERGQACE